MIRNKVSKIKKYEKKDNCNNTTNKNIDITIVQRDKK